MQLLECEMESVWMGLEKAERKRVTNLGLVLVSKMDSVSELKTLVWCLERRMEFVWKGLVKAEL